LASEANEALTRQLHRCEFLEDAHNVVLVGGPGTGKTHLATAIGVQAIEHHRKRVRFFSTVELVNALEQEKLQGKPGQIAARWPAAGSVDTEIGCFREPEASDAEAQVQSRVQDRGGTLGA
jgi:hypothetical protein